MKLHILFALVTVSGTAVAQIAPVSRSSSILAWEHIIDMGGNDHGVVSMSRSSTDFGVFDWSVSGGGYTASQNSWLNASAVSVFATGFGNPQSTFGFGAAESFFTLVFDISTPSAYRLEGQQARFIGEGSVALTGPGTNLLANADSQNPTPFLFEGVFDPGRYTLEVRTSADYGAATALLTVVPSPGFVALAVPVAALIARRRR